jgi:hypothetical protein
MTRIGADFSLPQKRIGKNLRFFVPLLLMFFACIRVGGLFSRLWLDLWR